MGVGERSSGREMRGVAGLCALLQGGERGMCEGPSRISGPIPPDPTLFPDYYRRPASGELERAAVGRVPHSITEPRTPPGPTPQPKDASREQR